MASFWMMSAGLAGASLAALLPPQVALATASLDDAVEPLAESERTAVAGAVKSRRREFAAGRTCARRALATLGVEPQAIPVGEMRQPVWPEGIVGSITHCRSFAAAALARATDLTTLGIDAEPTDRLDARVQTMAVATDAEQRGLERSGSRVAGEGVLFSAKEAVFKAWWPWRHCWLEFADVEVSLRPDEGTFRADVRPAGGAGSYALHGRFAVTAGYVLSAVAVPCPPGWSTGT